MGRLILTMGAVGLVAVFVVLRELVLLEDANDFEWGWE